MIDSASGNKIKENKYKILRMSLLLGNGEDREETINNFEDAARDIDAMNDEVYLKEIEKKFYDTLTLEEEEKKLSGLVDYIGGRAQQRVSLISDFANITGYELNGLAPIKYYDRLEEYKDRLSYIREYLDNSSKINELSKEVEGLESSLEKAYASKEKAEERNSSDERILLNKFQNIINRDSELKDIDIDNIDNILVDIKLRVSDSKKSLDIFEKSYSTLENAGISYEEEEEYSSYVKDARKLYYSNKEKEYLLSIYKLLISNESEYSKIIYKRDSINDILRDRINLRKELNVKDIDVLEDIYDLLDKQYNNIEKQRADIESIDVLSREINDKRDSIKELELDNQKVEILSLLKEFCIIDTYDDINKDDKIEDNNYNNDISGILDSSISNTVNIDNMNNDIFGSNNIDINNSMDNDIFTNDNVDVNNSGEVNLEVSNNIFDNNDNIDNSDSLGEVKDSQVVSVRDISNVNIDAIIKKANTVMRRVGKMLGVDMEDDEKIVSVSNESDSLVKEDNTNNNEDDISNKDNASGDDANSKSVNDEIIPIDANNLFFDNNVVNENIQGDDNDFWTGGSMDDGGLSGLPDLPVSNDVDSNNFFVSNEIPELKFDFGSNDSEGQ